MKTLFSATFAAIFSLVSVSAATVDLGTSNASATPTVLAAAATPLLG